MGAFDAIKINKADNTATVLRDIKAGDEVRVSAEGTILSVIAQQDIAFGHKIALSEMQPGTSLLKYGEVMGVATQNIHCGELVHVHNADSNRGRGDLHGDCNAVQSPRVNGREEWTLHAPFIDLSNFTFEGYVRGDGSVGTRNLVGVFSSVVCANDIVCECSDIAEAAVFTHQQGCSQTSVDVRRVESVLINLAANPNLGAVVVVGLGCESVRTPWVVEQIRATGKPVEYICIQQEGGKAEAVSKVRAKVLELAAGLNPKKTVCGVDKLRVGLKCGSSDTTQGVSANPVIGLITEALAAAGAQVVIGETTEFMGAEHIAAQHAKSQEVADAIVARVADMERRARAVGVDMRGGQPTRGNIAGGLTTIEEKSLGALAKAGSAVFRDVVDYGQRSQEHGLVMMDAPGREPEMLTGLAASGCNLVLFATGRGAPQGFPFVPVIKITGNERTASMMHEHIDCDVSAVIRGEDSLESAAEKVWRFVRVVLAGELTKAEKCRYFGAMNIYTTGPTI